VVDSCRALSSQLPSAEADSFLSLCLHAFLALCACIVMQGFRAKIDEIVKSQKAPFCVVPAEAAIQEYREILDPGFRRGDG